MDYRHRIADSDTARAGQGRKIDIEGGTRIVSGKNLANFVWSIADQLRGVYRPNQYGSVILPMTILRRLDCVLEPTKAAVMAEAAMISNPDQLDLVIRKKFGLNFYNTSKYDLATLLDDPDNLRSNLVDYIYRFSGNVADVFERFKFENEIATLEEKDRLYLVVQTFADVDLHPDAVSNADMGSMFEELIRKFAEASNETAGEHFTPRDAIALLVDLLFAADDEALSQPGIVRTVYDPTAGTGGMLSVAEEHLLSQNPDARLVMSGQEINDQSYAICKSDMIGKGQDTRSIQLGDTLRDDKLAGKTFDYCLSNPPYGVDWKSAEKDVRREHVERGMAGRFGAGLPGVGDGQMLFLCHLANKMRPLKVGGGRAGIVLNGSPLFNGKAESGESNIRKWLLESDLVDAIVALPTDMFYNTNISTYIWILDNNKPVERRGQVQLIDGTSFFHKMRKSLGNKRRELTEADRAEVVRIYEANTGGEHSRVFAIEDFGYRTITVERPLKLRFSTDADHVQAALATKPIAALNEDERAEVRTAIEASGIDGLKNRDQALDLLRAALTKTGLRLAAPAFKAVWRALSERDETADICVDAKGNPEPDVSLRDTENVPFADDIDSYFERAVIPYVPDAWVDHAKTRTGYEIPFARLFYRYVAPRSLEEIDDDLNTIVTDMIGLLNEVET